MCVADELIDEMEDGVTEATNHHMEPGHLVTGLQPVDVVSEDLVRVGSRDEVTGLGETQLQVRVKMKYWQEVSFVLYLLEMNGTVAVRKLELKSPVYIVQIC